LSRCKEKRASTLYILTWHAHFFKTPRASFYGRWLGAKPWVGGGCVAASNGRFGPLVHKVHLYQLTNPTDVVLFAPMVTPLALDINNVAWTPIRITLLRHPTWGMPLEQHCAKNRVLRRPCQKVIYVTGYSLIDKNVL